MKRIGKILREARLAQNLNQEELAKLLGVNNRCISTWETGTAKPDCLTLIRLCEALKISPNYLLGFATDFNPPSANELSLLRKYREIDSFGQNAVQAVLNAEYDRVLSARPKQKKARLLSLDFYDYPASAGTGNFLDTEAPQKIIVPETTEAEQADFVIPICGDSMEPTYHDGDRVLVERRDTIRSGEIGIFVLNGEAYIKELGNRCLISHNDAYKPIKIGADDSIICCGKVIGVIRE